MKVAGLVSVIIAAASIANTAPVTNGQTGVAARGGHAGYGRIAQRYGYGGNSSAPIHTRDVGPEVISKFTGRSFWFKPRDVGDREVNSKRYGPPPSNGTHHPYGY